MPDIRPTFIAIGPGKSGTTWIYNVLALHPEVGMSSAKETLFFEDYFHKGPEWYARFFKHCAGARAVGEVSNTYVFSPLAAERIHAFRPDMQIISSLRNPVDRAFSHYLFLLRNGDVEGSFESVLERRPDLVERGFYSRHLAPYLARFGRERVAILVFERLHRDPYGFARRIYEFLGVDPHFSSPLFEERAMEAAQARSRPLAQAAKLGAKLVRRAGYPELITRVRNTIVSRLLYRAYARDDYPRMNASTRDRLQTVFRGEVQRVSELVDEDLGKVWF
jgi:hypothetical protein